MNPTIVHRVITNSSQVVGKMPNGQELIVGAGDGGVVPSEAYDQASKPPGSAPHYSGGQAQGGFASPGYGVESYGSHTNQLPSYGSQLGNPAGSTLQGQQYPREKHSYN